jgi:methylmalonyl-CoA mutase cobalamin-binding subunit
LPTAGRRTGRPPRILLLTSGLGSGHVRAAGAIALAIRQRDERTWRRVIENDTAPPDEEVLADLTLRGLRPAPLPALATMAG